MRWEVGVAEMGSLRRIMWRELSCKARSPCMTFSTRCEPDIICMPCTRSQIPWEGEFPAFVYNSTQPQIELDIILSYLRYFSIFAASHVLVFHLTCEKQIHLCISLLIPCLD